MITHDVLIIGAGIAGLMAGQKLQEYGRSLLILDKGRGYGGRMATRRIGNGRADHGAQFFTVRRPKFQAHVDAWLTAGLITPWGYGWAGSADAAPTPDGHPRYVGTNGMTTVPKALAQTLDVRLNTRISRVWVEDGYWLCEDEENGRYRSHALLLTPPVPQSLALLDADGMALTPSDRAALDRITYDPCVAAMFLVRGDVALPPPGAIQRPGHTFPWIADNQRKGISTDAKLITVHASPALSWQLWDAPPAEKVAALLRGLRPFLAPNATIQDAQAHRWRYAQPTVLHPDRTLLAHGWPPLAFAGDAFREPRVEGAALSGLAAANALNRTLDNG